jgi:indole-3-glycerol phosphate synthase
MRRSGTVLDEILAHKREEVATRRRATPLVALRDLPLHGAPRRGFRAALAARPAPAVVAEMKRASPSRGVIRAAYDPSSLARGYAAAGAAALSVLTDERFFDGALEHLAAAREASGLPCLRKDFIVDAYQVEEARGYGADAVLVIAAAVEPALGRELLAAAAAAELDALVEVHSEPELEWAAVAGATLIGVNNRDLATFAVSLETTERLAPRVPTSALLVAESGIRSAADVARMVAAGARAVLVGEAFMERADPGAALAEWLACR